MARKLTIVAFSLLHLVYSSQDPCLSDLWECTEDTAKFIPRENLVFFGLPNKIKTEFLPGIERVELISDEALIEVESLNGPDLTHILIKMQKSVILHNFCNILTNPYLESISLVDTKIGGFDFDQRCVDQSEIQSRPRLEFKNCDILLDTLSSGSPSPVIFDASLFEPVVMDEVKIRNSQSLIFKDAKLDDEPNIFLNNVSHLNAIDCTTQASQDLDICKEYTETTKDLVHPRDMFPTSGAATLWLLWPFWLLSFLISHLLR